MVITLYNGNINQKEKILEILSSNQYADIPEYMKNINSMEKLELFLEQLDQDANIYLVSMSDNNIGLAMCYEINQAAYIGYVINKKYQRQGYGKQLVAKLIEYYRSINFTKLIAGVTRRNEASIEILRANNFEPMLLEKNKYILYIK